MQAGRSLRHDSDVYQGAADNSAAAPGVPSYSVGGLQSGQVAALIAFLALAGLTVFRRSIGAILPS